MTFYCCQRISSLSNVSTFCITFKRKNCKKNVSNVYLKDFHLMYTRNKKENRDIFY